MKTILVLEDDLGNMQGFCAILRSMSYRVLEATAGKEAIEASHKHEAINLFVSDIALPGLSGTEVALRLIQLLPNLVILFISGRPIDSSTESDRRNFRPFQAGSGEFLEKLVRVSALKTTVESLYTATPPPPALSANEG